jgi:hypothetical protein
LPRSWRRSIRRLSSMKRSTRCSCGAKCQA